MIELKALACSFDKKIILQDISLQIKNHLTILGANGSGKSTLAKAVCGLVEFSGEVFIESKNIKELSLTQRAKTLSYIPAKLEIYDNFITLYEFVLLGRFPYKKSFFEYSKRDKNITIQTLEFLKIAHLKNHTLNSLSSGEQQLALIAQALSQQSKIIIFDEPTANLDPHNSKIIAQHIKGLKEYHQVILITHDLHLASFVDSHVVFIKDKQAFYYEESFFNDSTLEKLYGVKFNSLVPKYD
ncbi:MAG: ABC transporter ATP-binding protein [Campylobacterota bacterium]|nr:ABC transporter ATP-binding protein [Campylobacterota bacterium]